MAAAAIHPHVRYHHHIPKPPEGSNRWVCIYPAYINKEKTVAEGRRIPKSKGVVMPTCKEITEVLAPTGLPIYVENKIYCREQSKEPPNWGRVRVQLKVDNEAAFLDPKFKTREDLYFYVAEHIPKLKSRTNPKQTQSQPNQQGKQGPQQGKQGKGKKKK